MQTPRSVAEYQKLLLDTLDTVKPALGAEMLLWRSVRRRVQRFRLDGYALAVEATFDVTRTNTQEERGVSLTRLEEILVEDPTAVYTLSG